MTIYAFLVESLAIEGIFRAPSPEELSESDRFLTSPIINLRSICTIQKIYTPHATLRNTVGMDVTIEGYAAPPGGPSIGVQLDNLAQRILSGLDPWAGHIEFRNLHPFTDGNGRISRIIWAWSMVCNKRDPFARSFLQSWYRQTMAFHRDDSKAPPA